jgi:hypothetical protein
MQRTLRVVYRIAPGLEGPRAARRIISGELSAFVPRRRLEDLKLLISELVSGRVTERGQALPQPEEDQAPALTLDLEAQEVVRCTIIDPAGASGLPSAWSGRILDLLADRWGLVHEGTGTRIWFETARSA